MVLKVIKNALDPDYPPGKESFVLQDTDDTYFGKYAIPLTEQHSDEGRRSGFHEMVDGIDALATRLLMARKAEKSIDAQYYLIKDDAVGRMFLHSLLQAADRGVRVRLLLDDMFTTGYDVGMTALCLHPHFEVRVFNPFPRDPLTGKNLVGSMLHFQRTNRRMHNKTFTVDNNITIIGGRNIADEYFGNSKTARFHDDDVLMVGPIVQEVSSLFDSYWNHETAVPAPAFCQRDILRLNNPQTELNLLRDQIFKANSESDDTKYAKTVQCKIEDYLKSDGMGTFRWVPYQLVADPPDKGLKSLTLEKENCTTQLMESMKKAKERVILVSPYFVPQEPEMKLFGDLQKRGVQVTIVTNSLAANNMFLVHGGYVPTRKPLLQAGVKLYEARPDTHVPGSECLEETTTKKKSSVFSRKRKTTLHTKAFIVDTRETFIGSFNFDPRSIHLNTESGVILRDDRTAQERAQELLDSLPTKAYELFLTKRGRVRWRTTCNGKEVIFKSEPQSSLPLRFAAVLARMAPKGQL